MTRHILIALSLSLTACAAVVPTTALQLMALSPLTADPEGLAVQIDLPETVGVQPGSATMTITNTYLGETDTFVSVLERQGTVYRIAAEDIAPLRALQAKIRERETTAPDDNSGSLSIFAQPCLKSDLASPDDEVSVAVQAAQDGPFLPLIRKQPLSALFGEIDLTDFPLCEAP